MSSVCSANSSTSPDVASSNVSSNKMNESNNNDASAARLRTTVPDVKKDNKYWERRRRNNEAARRSREKRRMNDMNMDNRIMELSQRNKLLEQELYQFKISSPNSGSHFDTAAKKSKLAPIIPASDSNGKEKLQTTQLNGMVFPIFTTIKPVISTSDIAETKDPNIASVCKINVSHDTTRFQTNLLTFSNIPLLSNIIATTNYNDDIITKPTLLLPPFQIPPKTIVETTVANDMSTISVSECQEGTKETDDFQVGFIKTELQDVLDLRMKPENTAVFFDLPGTLSTGFDAPVIDGHGLENSVSINNSFLSGSVLPAPGKSHSPIPTGPLTPPVTECNEANDRYNYYNPTRRHKPPGEQIGNHYRRHRKDSLDHVLSHRARLQIREEVATAVCRENVKLQDAIGNLTDEIRQLKTVLMSLAVPAPAILTSTDSRLNPIIERLRSQPQDKATNP